MVGACVTKKFLILWNNIKINDQTYHKKALNFRWFCDAGCQFNFCNHSLDLILEIFLVRQQAPLPSLRWHPQFLYPTPICSTEFANVLWSFRWACGNEGRALLNARFRHNSGVLSSYAVRRFEHVHPFLMPKVWCGRNQGLGHHKNVATNHDDMALLQGSRHRDASTMPWTLLGGSSVWVGHAYRSCSIQYTHRSESRWVNSQKVA